MEADRARDTARFFQHNLERFAAGDALDNVVDKAAGY